MAFNTTMVKKLASRHDNFVAIVRNVHVFVESFTYVMNFTIFEDIGEYIESELSKVSTQHWYNRALNHLGHIRWSRIPPLLVLSDRYMMNGLIGSGGGSFWKEGDDFGVDVLRFHICLTDILGFLEKLQWWFEQDIDDEGEEDEEDGNGDEV
ncbi:hypothetical protein Tco_0567860 [Tanacetum coccineum]